MKEFKSLKLRFIPFKKPDDLSIYDFSFSDDSLAKKFYEENLEFEQDDLGVLVLDKKTDSFLTYLKIVRVDSKDKTYEIKSPLLTDFPKGQVDSLFSKLTTWHSNKTNALIYLIDEKIVSECFVKGLKKAGFKKDKGYYIYNKANESVLMAIISSI